MRIAKNEREHEVGVLERDQQHRCPEQEQRSCESQARDRGPFSPSRDSHRRGPRTSLIRSHVKMLTGSVAGGLNGLSIGVRHALTLEVGITPENWSSVQTLSPSGGVRADWLQPETLGDSPRVEREYQPDLAPRTSPAAGIAPSTDLLHLRSVIFEYSCS